MRAGSRVKMPGPATGRARVASSDGGEGSRAAATTAPIRLPRPDGHVGRAAAEANTTTSRLSHCRAEVQDGGRSTASSLQVHGRPPYAGRGPRGAGGDRPVHPADVVAGAGISRDSRPHGPVRAAGRRSRPGADRSSLRVTSSCRGTGPRRCGPRVGRRAGGGWGTAAARPAGGRRGVAGVGVACCRGRDEGSGMVDITGARHGRRARRQARRHSCTRRWRRMSGATSCTSCGRA